jgi:putative hydrolase of HD superfamily
MGYLMNATTLGRQIIFLREIEKLKGVTRANKTLNGRNENSAENSWHVALMALLPEEHAQSQLDMLDELIVESESRGLYV